MARSSIMEKGFGKSVAKFFAVAAVSALIDGAASSSQAAINYVTGFEAPIFTSGTSVAGTDGWAAGSGSGASQPVTNTRSNGGTQSLFFDNTSTNTSFYSVTHPLGTFAGTILTLSVDLYIPSTNGADRLAEVEFSTGTLGSGTLGFSLDGAGGLRAGKTWSALYSGSALATAPAGTFANRWLTVTLTLNTSTSAGTVSISGFGGTTNTFSANFTGVTTPTNINLGSDYLTSTAPSGSVYFDNLAISTAAVPEPSTVAVCVLATGLVGLVIRRRRNGTAAA